MRLRSRLIGFASVGLLVAFAASDTFAQGAQPGGQSSPPGTSAPSASGSAGQQGKGAGAAPSTSTQGKAGAGASQGPWTADNVTAARPFGDINIQAAGTTNESVRTWSQGRTAAEREELNERCEVITNPANASKNYPMNAMQFCRTYMMVAAVNPPAGSASSPSGTPGAAGKSSAPAGKTP